MINYDKMDIVYETIIERKEAEQFEVDSSISKKDKVYHQGRLDLLNEILEIIEEDESFEMTDYED